MREFSVILVICILVMSMVCAGQRMAEVTPPAEIDAARRGGVKPLPHSVIDECARLATFSGDIGARGSAPVQDWKLASPVNTYDEKTLFDYIDGAAELYFAYDFRAVSAAEYQNGETSIMIDVYDMTSPENAFGIYSLNRYPGANYMDIGNEGILTGAALDFWKGRYFCKVYSFDMSEKYENIVVNFGNRLASRIQEVGEEPSVVRSLPQDGLIPRTARFFSRKLGLDNIRYVSEGNVLNLNAETRGVIAEYQINDSSFLEKSLSKNRGMGDFPHTASFEVFIIEYPLPEEANSAFEAYSSYLDEEGEHVSLQAFGKSLSKNRGMGDFPHKAIDGKAKMVKTDGKFTFVKLRGRIISGFWDIESQEIADQALEKLEQKQGYGEFSP